MSKKVRPYWIYYGGGLTGSDYYWLHSLKRSTNTRLPQGWKHWTWQFVRPEHAWLSQRGWVCFQEDWLPAGYEKKPVVSLPIPDDAFDNDDNFPCVDEGCSC
jgi:hypothetical protein